MRKHLLLAAGLVGAISCAGEVPSAPTVRTPAFATRDEGGRPPGQKRTGDAVAGRFTPINCSPKSTATGTALIGPSGGIINIGTHRLIVPAGALQAKVQISGTVPEGKPFQIDLQPHGLRFKKAAGLILDATSCVDVPRIVYLIDQVNVSEPIDAFYSNWWKAIACPIWHFSGYAIYLGERGGDESAGGTQ